MLSLECPCLGTPLSDIYPELVIRDRGTGTIQDKPACLQVIMSGSQFPVRTRSCLRWTMQGIDPLGQGLLKTPTWDGTRASGPSVGPPLPLLWLCSFSSQSRALPGAPDARTAGWYAFFLRRVSLGFFLKLSPREWSVLGSLGTPRMSHHHGGPASTILFCPPNTIEKVGSEVVMSSWSPWPVSPSTAPGVPSLSTYPSEWPTQNRVGAVAAWSWVYQNETLTSASLFADANVITGPAPLSPASPPLERGL